MVDAEVLWAAAGVIAAVGTTVVTMIHSNNRANRAESRLERQQIEQKGEDARKAIYERLAAVESAQGILAEKLEGHERLCNSREDTLGKIEDGLKVLTNTVQDIAVIVKARQVKEDLG